MTTVSLATHCHARDLPRLHAPGELESLIAGHNYPFDEILVIHQRTDDLPYTLPDDSRIRVIDIREEDYPTILGTFGMNPNDAELDRITHGWSWQWYWQHHCVNHCTEILFATSDYVVFNDADCRIKSQPEGESWVTKAIQILEGYPEVFIVSPSEGGYDFEKMLPDGTRLVRTTSQQLFMGRGQQMAEMDFTNLPWNGQFDAPGGPMQEWYGMFEGHMGRWMKHKGGLYRAILPESYRYWHFAYH